jgi:hypothetical protein
VMFAAILLLLSFTWPTDSTCFNLFFPPPFIFYLRLIM